MHHKITKLIFALQIFISIAALPAYVYLELSHPEQDLHVDKAPAVANQKPVPGLITVSSTSYTLHTKLNHKTP